MKRFLATVVALTIPLPSMASSFSILGLRPMGMGGANVAIAEGPTAQYWNPGALSMTKGSGFQLPVSAGFEATGDILQKANAIASFSSQIQALQNLQTNGGALNLQQVADFNDALVRLTALNQVGTGALVNASAGADMRAGRYAFSVNNFDQAGASPFVDTKFNLGAIGGVGGVTLTGDASLNDSANAASRDTLAGVIGNLSQKFGATIAGGQSATTVANQLINAAANQGSTPAQIADLVNQAQSLNGQLASSGITGASAHANGSKGAGSPSDVSSGISGALADNTTRVVLRGAAMSEVSLGYGLPLPLSDRYGELGIGANAKVIRGDIGYANVNLVSGQDTSVGKTLSDATKNYKTTYRPALDLGLLYRAPFRRRVQLGLLARNINSPTFSQPDSAVADGEPAYKENAQVRTGIAFWPWKRLTLGADLDVTKNKTEVPGFYSRNLGLGGEVNVLFFSLRAGLLKNVEANTPLAYTAGIGLHIFAFKLDVGGAISSKTVHIDNTAQAIPASVQVGASVGLVFGGGKRSSRH